ncbi:MAG: PD-(D/E)XK nuclease family protein, partial [Candidatus Omnitrophica bacterium]|nr:PD-(D/E)XK nuclease family protein [Candidatus Omnitrophota bacterium]
IELLEMLSERHKNICVVGDDDQAIYRFRGASYASFLKFKEKFPKLKTIKLTQNYRSTKRILNTAARLIKNNGIDRYDPKKNLWTEKGEGSEVAAYIAHDYIDEAKRVADEIEALYRGFKGKEKRYSRIAVLYRAHTHKDALLRELKSRIVPVTVVRGVGLLETEEIRDLVAYLKIIDDPTDSVSLFRVLTSAVWEVDIDDLITISDISNKEEVPLYDVIKRLDVLKGIAESTRGQLKKFKEDLRELIRASKRSNASDLFLGLLEKTGYIRVLLDKKKSKRHLDSDQKILNVGKFFDFCMRYLKNNPDQSLEGFLAYLDCFMEAGGSAEQEDLSLDEDGVRFMTVHSAKGLEFPYVFLISLVQNRFPTMKRREPIPFPDSLMKEKLPEGDFHREEERRLCYVAMTRAEDRLYLSCIDKPRNKASVFLKEVMAGDACEKGDIVCEDIGLDDDIDSRINSIVDRFKTLEEKKGKKYSLPKPGKLSYTQLDTYNTCPLMYKFSYIYRIPRRRRNALTFGTNMHSTLEDFFRFVQEKKPVDENVLFELFSKHWTPRGYESKMDEANYRRTGEKSLKVFFKKHKDMLHKPPLFLEKKMDLKVGAFVLDVRIDRIDDLGKNSVEIIDYKTGKPKDEKFAKESLQLSIYGLACRDVLRLNPERLSFYYVNPNEKVTTTRNAEDYETTKKTITETGKKILSEEFEPTPGRICKWCDYASICPVWDKR